MPRTKHHTADANPIKTRLGRVTVEAYPHGEVRLQLCGDDPCHTHWLSPADAKALGKALQAASEGAIAKANT